MSIVTFNQNIHERLPIIPNTAHCSRALALVNSNNIFFAIGRAEPWQDEDVEGFIPPAPDVEATTLDGIIGMKKADRVIMVVPDEEGEIEYASIKFRTITNEEALALKSRWVLIETKIFYEELPPIPYRQMGVFSNVKPTEGNETKQVLLPEEIEDVGILEIINNRKVVTRQSDTREHFFMVIEC